MSGLSDLEVLAAISPIVAFLGVCVLCALTPTPQPQPRTRAVHSGRKSGRTAASSR